MSKDSKTIEIAIDRMSNTSRKIKKTELIMPEELKPDPKQAVGQEAELAAQSIVEGKEKMPEVDVDADYEASKKYSVSDVDKTGAGAEAATAATAPEHEIPKAKEREVIAESTANPDDYREMAKEVNPRANQ